MKNAEQAKRMATFEKERRQRGPRKKAATREWV
jgi:hypothetical protein